jgi:hypothetical protein
LQDKRALHAIGDKKIKKMRTQNKNGLATVFWTNQASTFWITSPPLSVRRSLRP